MKATGTAKVTENGIDFKAQVHKTGGRYFYFSWGQWVSTSFKNVSEYKSL